MGAEAEALKVRTKKFALRVLRLYRSLPHTEEARILGRQILRSGTSIGANYRAACRGRSRAEFAAKLGIVLEEADESAYWMELLIDAGKAARQSTAALLREADELVAISVSSINTARKSGGGAG